jgi:hypothetical protein
MSFRGGRWSLSYVFTMSRCAKIVRFEAPEQYIYEEIPEDIAEAFPRVEWGHRGDMLFTQPVQGETADRLRALLGCNATEIDVTSEYLFGSTMASPAYDGFGTMTIETGPDGRRTVAVRRDREEWQITRYLSACGNGFEPAQTAALDDAAAA